MPARSRFLCWSAVGSNRRCSNSTSRSKISRATRQGDALDIRLREVTLHGKPFLPRPYQEDAAGAFWQNGAATGGSGVLVLPCGAGKTIIGIQSMVKAQMMTLIIVTGITAAHQWRDEILDKTNITPDMIGEYSGERKEIKPITIATYQVLTARRDPNKAPQRQEERRRPLSRTSIPSGSLRRRRPTRGKRPPCWARTPSSRRTAI